MDARIIRIVKTVLLGSMLFTGMGAGFALVLTFALFGACDLLGLRQESLILPTILTPFFSGALSAFCTFRIFRRKALRRKSEGP